MMAITVLEHYYERYQDGEIREMINRLQEGTSNAVATMERSSEQSQVMQDEVESARQALEAIASLNHLTALAGQVREELGNIQQQSESLGDSADTIEGIVRQFRV